jgi:hypothetical protein
VVYAETIVSPSEGQALATRLLASESAASQPLTLTTTEGDDVEAGDALTVNISSQGGINDTFIVESIETQILPSVRISTITLIDEDAVHAAPVDEWRELLGGSGGGAVALATSGGSGGSGGTSLSTIFLGGREDASMDAGDWTDIWFAVPLVAQETFTGRVRLDLWARESGAGVTARLRNVTDATAVESSEITSTTRTELTFVAPITSGKRYRVQVKRTTGSGGVYAAAAQLEYAA